MNKTDTTTPEETPAAAWARPAVFHKKALIESLMAAGCKQSAKDIRTFPLCPYILPGVQDLK